ncbi:hypothetical protein D3C81_985650 [compost metagenome]
MLAGLEEQLVDLFGRGLALEVDGEVHQRHVDHRHPHRHPGQLAGQFRQHQAHRFGGTGLARDHRLGG